MLLYADAPSDDWSRPSTRHALIARIAQLVASGQPIEKAARLIEPNRNRIDAAFVRQLHTALVFRGGKPESEWRAGFVALFPQHADALPPSKDARNALMREEPIEVVQQRAAAGEAPAIFEIGRRHLQANEDEKALAAFRRAADDRYSAAILMVGQLLKEGRGTKQDTAAARDWFIEAAMVGNASAQLELAEDLLAEGDVSEALYWFESSMRGGEISAGLRLSFLYTGLEGVARNEQRSYFWLNRAAAEDYPDAVAELGRRFENGDALLEQDVDYAIELYDRAIILGSSDAAYYLGGLVEEGEHIERDLDGALQLYQSAATGGTPDAWFAGGRLLWQEMDDVEGARAFFQMGAEQDDVKSKWGLAQILMTAESPSSSDLKRAAQLLRDAADDGLAMAKINLVDASEDPDFMRIRGAHAFAMEPDEKERLIFEAAEGGDAYAAFRAGLIHFKANEFENALQYFMLGAGEGDARCMNNAAQCEEKLGRPERAVEWYREAAANGHRNATFNLAQMYRLGNGVTKNIEEAKKWYAVAAEAGDEDAKRILKKL